MAVDRFGFRFTEVGLNNQEREALIAFASLPVHRRRVERSIEVIREALAIAPAYVAVSWGKDSTVLLHLCQQVEPDIKALFLAHSEMDLISNFSEVGQQYCDRFQPNYEQINLSLEDELIYSPTKIKDKLSGYAKDYPVAIVGVRAEESINRRRSIQKYGQIHPYQGGGYRAFPIAYWSWQDIWAYICSQDLPFLEAYNKTPRSGKTNRTAIHFGKSSIRRLSIERWAQFRIIAPEYWQYIRRNFPEAFDVIERL